MPLVALHLLDPAPQGILAGAARWPRYQPIFNLIVTNVPGPTTSLYLLGARLLEAFTIVPLLGNQGLGVAALSTTANSPWASTRTQRSFRTWWSFVRVSRRPSTCSKGDRSLGHPTLVPRGGTEKTE